MRIKLVIGDVRRWFLVPEVGVYGVFPEHTLMSCEGDRHDRGIAGQHCTNQQSIARGSPANGRVRSAGRGDTGARA